MDGSALDSVDLPTASLDELQDQGERGGRPTAAREDQAAYISRPGRATGSARYGLRTGRHQIDRSSQQPLQRLLKTEVRVEPALGGLGELEQELDITGNLVHGSRHGLPEHHATDAHPQATTIASRGQAVLRQRTGSPLSLYTPTRGLRAGHAAEHLGSTRRRAQFPHVFRTARSLTGTTDSVSAGHKPASEAREGRPKPAH
jgi:hypothetical protein